MKKSGKIHIESKKHFYPLCGTNGDDYDYISIGAVATLEYYGGFGIKQTFKPVCQNCFREYLKITSKGGAK